MTAAPSGVSEHHCANCGAVATDRYCPACGQDTRERLPTFGHFMREATGRYLAFDGKLWKTLFPLLFRPGFLTRAYFAGRRRRYIGPARLFLVSSLVLFAVLRFASESIDVDTVMQTASSDSADGANPDPKDAAKTAAKGTPMPAAKSVRNAADEDLVVFDEDLNFSLGHPPDWMGPVKKRVERFNHLPRGQKVEQIIAGTLRYGPYAMFVLLPAFAALLKLLYLGRRRRRPLRPRLYGEHLVFAAHNHTFLFVLGILIFAVPVEPVRVGLAFWAVCYLAWSMRAVYGGSWLGIAVRSFALFIVYTVLFSLVTLGLLIVAVLLR